MNYTHIEFEDKSKLVQYKQIAQCGCSKESELKTQLSN